MPESYRSVRALERGLRLLEALSDLGWAKPGALSAHTGIDRTTVYRLIGTLEDLGYVVRREEDGAIGLHRRLARISDSARDSSALAQAAEPILQSLTRSILWPSDFGAVAGGRLTILASTNRMSPFSVNRASIGNQVPLLRSALGRAVVSMMEPEQCRMMLEVAAGLLPEDRDEALAAHIRAQVERTGYAVSAGGVTPGVSAIALPIRSRDVLSAVNIVFASSAMSPERAAEMYLGQLRECVQEVERLFGRMTGGE